MAELEFVEFPKIARLSRECIITEKIDGTNAQILIEDDFNTLHVGSRTKWISPTDDNHGFAKWVEANKEEILRLGPGQHFGEWWGQGIQRTYGLKEKRFSLFNVTRWGDELVRPKCCSIVPVRYRGLFTTSACEEAVEYLRLHGSQAVPGFMNPEGIVVFHMAANMGFKKTLNNDGMPKSMVKP